MFLLFTIKGSASEPPFYKKAGHMMADHLMVNNKKIVLWLICKWI